MFLNVVDLSIELPRENEWEASRTVLVSSFYTLSLSTSLSFFMIISSVSWQALKWIF